MKRLGLVKRAPSRRADGARRLSGATRSNEQQQQRALDARSKRARSWRSCCRPKPGRRACARARLTDFDALEVVERERRLEARDLAWRERALAVECRRSGARAGRRAAEAPLEDQQVPFRETRGGVGRNGSAVQPPSKASG
jgi:hypothetical protein